MQVDEVVLDEPAQDLRHERVEHTALLAAKIIEPVIGHLDAAADPPVGVVKLDELGDLPAAADAVAGGEHPERQQDLRIDRRRAGALAARPQLAVQAAQIELLDDRDDRARGKRCGERGVEIDAAPAELRAIGPAQAEVALWIDGAARRRVIRGHLVEQRLLVRAWITIHGAHRRQPSRHSQVWAVGRTRSCSSSSAADADEYGST